MVTFSRYIDVTKKSLGSSVIFRVEKGSKATIFENNICKIMSRSFLGNLDEVLCVSCQPITMYIITFL
jgi:hypothetical protein